MSDNTDFGFARLVPGFDFLQNLAKGTTQGMPQMPGLSSWIAPTLNVEELDKRIAELKAVQFWLEQNGTALSATIQALEVQKMTLATLKSMNVGMGEMAEALRMKPPAKAEAKPTEPKPREPRATETPAVDTAGKGNGAAGAVDPLQWWGALTQQFQEIAANAMKDVAQKAASGKEAMQAASGMAAPAVSSIPKESPPAPAKKSRAASGAKKAPPAKAAPRKRASRPA